MKQVKLLSILIVALELASCRPTARQTVADVVQPTDSTDAVTSENTLRMLITDKSLSQTDSLIRRILKLPLDSIVVEMMNNTDSTCVTGEAYTIEHSTRLFTIHVDSDKYDFERGQEYRIAKELFKLGQNNSKSVYCYFTIE